MGVIAWFGIIVFLLAGCGSLWLFFSDAIKPKRATQPQRVIKAVARPRHRQKRYYQRRIRELQRQNLQLVYFLLEIQRVQTKS